MRSSLPFHASVPHLNHPRLDSVSLLIFTVLALALPGLRAQTTLSLGDIQTLGVTSDANDSFTFVIWLDIAANTVIRFMDQSFTNQTNGVLGTENDMSLSFSTALSAGTVVRVEDTGLTLVNGGAFAGTKTGSLSGISSSGDQVLIYQGTAMGSGTDFSGRTLLHGFNIADTSWITTGTATSNISYLPTAINGLDRNLDSGNFDNAQYSGTRAGMTTAAYRASIGNIANYTQSDTRFDLTTDAFAIDPSTEIHWDANGTTAGDGGTATWDTTTQSRFKNGAAGTTYLRWVNSSTGNDHTAVFGGTAGTVSVASGGVTASGLTFNTTGYVVQSNTITLSGSTTPIISVGSGLTATINSALAGTSGFTKTGDGILVLGGDQTGLATTGITVSAGTLRAGAADTNFIPSAGTLTIESGATVDLNGWNESIAGLSGAGTVTTGAVTTNVRFEVNSNTSSTFDGFIQNGSGSIYLEKNGTGTLTLTNASNSFNSTLVLGDRSLPTSIVLSAGRLAFTSNGALGAAGGDIYLDGGSFTADALVFDTDGITLDAGRILNVNNLTAIEVGSGRTGTIAGAVWGDDNNGSSIGGNDSIRKSGAGTLALTGTTDQLDEIFVAEGTLRAETGLSTARITMSSGAVLQVGNNSATGDLNGSSATVVNDGTVRFQRSGSLTFDNAISGTGSVDQERGILTLTAANSYTGTTNVNGGTLIVNGDQSTATGAVSVADTTTLGGIGSVGGATTFASGSTLSPGTSAGNISQALDFASLTMAAGSFWLVDLVNAVANDSDLVSVVNSGGLSISGALTINEVSGTFTETTGYRIVSYTGALGGLGRFSNDNGSGLITSGVGNTWSINYNNGGFITLTSLTAVPEPGTLGLLGVALGGFFVRRFRRRSSRDCTPGK